MFEGESRSAKHDSALDQKEDDLASEGGEA